MNELKFGRNTTLLLNKNPLIPTYEEVTKTINLIKKTFPKRSIEKIIARLYSQLIIKPKEEERREKIEQRRKDNSIIILCP